MNRRQFLYASTILETVSGVSTAFGAQPSKYDLIVKGGRVIDPSRGLNAIRDVGIVKGHIAAVEAALKGSAVETIDARGKLVVPGLVDIHTHAAYKEGLALCLNDGVTALIDAGTRGADGIDETIAAAKRAPQLCRVLINIGRNGALMQEGDTMQISRADVGAAREAISRNRDMVVGVKARLSQNVTGANDREVLRRSQEVASSFHLPVMIHMGQTASPLATLLPMLKSGDIVTHMFAPPPNSIIDNDGKMLPEVIEARKRGVLFDLGNGRNGHLRWDIAERVLQAGFLPDTLSTDWTLSSREEQVINFPNVMSKFLMLGLSLEQVVTRTTVNASRMFPAFRTRGTLKQGAPADIAVLELREGNFDFVDNYANKRAGRQKLFPSVTVLAGKQVAGPAQKAA